jgi:heterotetrameric sarcosine oxidase beta subunit
MRAFPSWARSFRAAPARRATTRSPGASPAAPTVSASTSSSAAKSPASCSTKARSSAWGPIRAGKVGLAVAGHTGHLAARAGLRLPLETHCLQAFVSEPLAPMIDSVISYAAAHFYISQSDTGGLVLGGDIDGYNSYAQRGGLPLVGEVLASAKALIPSISRLRIQRQWAGVVDMTMDGSPFICKSPVDGLYINGGWNYGGFKATPASGWCFAWTLANDAPHPDNARFTLDRFRNGEHIDENGGGPVPHAH